MRAVNQRLARIPVWVASLLVMLSLALFSTYAAAVVSLRRTPACAKTAPLIAPLLALTSFATEWRHADGA